MAGKRAGGNLNHDNWDDEEAPEEAGVFSQADESELKTRVFKKAKRRGVVSDDLANKPALFTGFKGFGIPVQNNPTFSFNKKVEEKSSTTTESSTEKPASSEEGSTSPSASSDEPADKNKGKFLAALKALNKAMLEWLNSHMDQNPYCYFTPVFVDYQKHLDRIKARYNYDDGTGGATPPIEDIKENSAPSVDAKEAPTAKPAAEPKQSTTSPASSIFASSTASPAPTFSFGSTKKVEPEAKKAGEDKSAPPMFGLTSKGDGAATKDNTAPSFSFGTKSSSSDAAVVKSDSSIKPFSFLVKSTASGETESTTAVKDSSAEGGDKPAPIFSFGKKPADGTPAATGSIFGPSSSTSGTFSFGLAKSTPSTAAPFSFGKAADSSTGSTSSTTVNTFSFKSAVANAKATNNEPTAATGEDEEYVPPKAEVEKQITEDDALYTKRVKLFYNKDGKYVDKGIGNLFVKPLESGKNSLLIRADTNLGLSVTKHDDEITFSWTEVECNILLNISLADSIPVKRMGKNNVTLVCVPNPPMEIVKGSQDPPPPTMLLIRVKEEADADELCDKLNEYKSVS